MFNQGSNSIGTGSVSGGVAAFTPSTTYPVGQYTISAIYSGNSNFLSSTTTTNLVRDHYPGQHFDHGDDAGSANR